MLFRKHLLGQDSLITQVNHHLSSLSLMHLLSASCAAHVHGAAGQMLQTVVSVTPLMTILSLILL